MQHPLRVFQKTPGELIVLRLPVFRHRYARLPQLIDPGAGKGHQNGRMRGNDKLGILLHQLVQHDHQRQQPGGRQRRLRLVQQIQALPAEAVLHQRKKALPVGLVVQGHAAVAVNQPGTRGGLIQFVNVGGHVVKTLRPEKEAIFGIAPPGGGQELAQWRVGGPGGKGEI